MPWFTTKKGKHINTDWLDPEAQLKFKQIQANKLVAQQLAGVTHITNPENNKPADTFAKTKDRLDVFKYAQDSYNNYKSYNNNKNSNKPDLFGDRERQINDNKQIANKMNEVKQPGGTKEKHTPEEIANRYKTNLAKKGITSQEDIENWLKTKSSGYISSLARDMQISNSDDDKLKTLAQKIYSFNQPQENKSFEPTITNKYGFEVTNPNVNSPSVTFTDAHWKQMQTLKEMRAKYDFEGEDAFADIQLRDAVDEAIYDMDFVDNEDVAYLYNAINDGDLTDDEMWAGYHQLANLLGVKAPRFGISEHGEMTWYEDGLFATKEKALEYAKAKGYTHIYDRYTGEYTDITRAGKQLKGEYESVLGPRQEVTDVQARMQYLYDNNAINPNYKRYGQEGEEYNKWHKNCALCSTAAILQARGYDVEAMPRNPNVWRGPNTVFDLSNLKPEDCILSGGNGYHFEETDKVLDAIKVEANIAVPRSNYNDYWEWKDARDAYMDNRLKDFSRMPRSAEKAAQLITEKMKEWGPNSIAELSLDWRDSVNSHSVVVLYHEGLGKAYIYDTQNNKSYFDMADYMTRANGGKGSIFSHNQLIRMDNLPLKKGMELPLSQMVKKRNK